MKVICKCCHKMFDYDMYMGLCPKCGRVYRREKGMYTDVEKDMVGDFHLHVDDGGLNRGIAGVVYNQGSEEVIKTLANGFDEDMEDYSQRSVRPAPRPEPSYESRLESRLESRPTEGSYRQESVTTQGGNNQRIAATQRAAQPLSTRQALYRQSATANSNTYFDANHKTALNKPITDKKKNDSISYVIVGIIIIISIIMGMLSN